MAVSVSYQTWTSGTYNWLDTTTSTAVTPQIDDLLDTWVAAVNGNAANTNKQITVTKSPASSTSANFVGWVIEAASNTSGSGFFTRFYTSTTSNLTASFSETFNDNGTNGNYGAVAGANANDGSISFATSGVVGEFVVASDTVNEQEFFALGWRTNNLTSQSDQLIIYKDTAGEWAAAFSDGGIITGAFYMATHSTPQRCFIANNPAQLNASLLERWSLIVTSNATHLATAGSEMTVRSVAANANVLYTSTAASHGFGKWASIAGGKTAVCLGLGPLFISYVP